MKHFWTIRQTSGDKFGRNWHIKRHINTWISFIWDYNHVSMTFLSKVPAHISSCFEQQSFWTFWRNSANYPWWIWSKLSKGTSICKDLSLDPITKSVNFRSKVLVRTMKRWQTEKVCGVLIKWNVYILLRKFKEGKPKCSLVWKTSIIEILQKMKLPTLVYRRLRGDWLKCIK